jgi:chemotaxis protein histidine kinase CheA
MATAEEVQTVEVEGIGAIEYASFPYVPGGGIVIFKGPKGCGKSTAAKAVVAAASGKGKLPLRDRATKGEVRGFGVTLRIGARTSRTGEPYVESLEGKFDVASIIDPGIADPIAADSKRIKSLVSLAASEPDPELFAKLFGNDEELFDAIVSDDAKSAPDVVVMADKVKRNCEKVARDEEKAAESAAARAAALKQTAVGIDPNAESDGAKLNAAYVEAIQEESRLKAEAAAQQTARDASAKAKKALDDAEANSQLPSVADAQKAETAALRELGKASDACNAAHDAYVKAKAALKDADDKAARCQQELKAAKEFDQLSESWREAIAAAEAMDGPSLDDVQQASSRVAEARAAQERGVEIRKAIENLALAKEAEAHAATHAKAAKTLRTIASKTDDILSAEVAKLGTPLRVEAGRLVTDTKRGPTLYSELSDGERSFMAFEIAANVIGEYSVMEIPQRTWGETQPADKEKLKELCRKRHICAYTAVVTDDAEMYAEVMP